MKPKRVHKKLSLNRKTIAILTKRDEGNALGGGVKPPTDYTCLADTCVSDCSNCQTICGSCAVPPNACNIW